MGLKLLNYSEKLLQREKLTNSIVDILKIFFEKCNFKYFCTIKFYYCPNLSLNNINNNNNTYIAAIAQLPLTMHPRSWAELLTFGPKFTLPIPSV